MMGIIARTDITTTMTAKTSYLSFKLMPVFLTSKLFFLVDDIIRILTKFFYGHTRISVISDGLFSIASFSYLCGGKWRIIQIFNKQPQNGSRMKTKSFGSTDRLRRVESTIDNTTITARGLKHDPQTSKQPKSERTMIQFTTVHNNKTDNRNGEFMRLRHFGLSNVITRTAFIIRQKRTIHGVNRM